jgi:AraC-like DNA-binding protein
VVLSFACDCSRPEARFDGTATFAHKGGLIKPEAEYFFVMFWPCMSYLLLGNRLPAIVDRSVSLDEVLLGKPASIKERIALSKTFRERIYVFEQFLDERIALLEGIPDGMSVVVSAMDQISNSLRSEELAGSGVYSERHIRRLFFSYAGVSPRLFARIIRHQRTLRALNLDPRQNLAELAFEQGYYDQSHFIKEFRRFQGSTPLQFIKDFTRKRHTAPQQPVEP